MAPGDFRCVIGQNSRDSRFSPSEIIGLSTAVFQPGFNHDRILMGDWGPSATRMVLRGLVSNPMLALTQKLSLSLTNLLLLKKPSFSFLILQGPNNPRHHPHGKTMAVAASRSGRWLVSFILALAARYMGSLTLPGLTVLI